MKKRRRKKKVILTSFSEESPLQLKLNERFRRPYIVEGRENEGQVRTNIFTCVEM